MSHPVKLVGLDFGTTTSSAVIARAQLVRNAVTGRTELNQLQECYRSDIVFTPLRDDRIDEAAVQTYLDHWLAAGDVRPEEIFGGGALLTGLTAQKANAATLVRLVRRRLGDALIATADDPRLESWLAFMGSCAELSRAHPQLPVLNLDIGGGTTNLALGQAGAVLRTGCLFVGARHIQVEPGTYRIVKVSSYVDTLMERLHLVRKPGDVLTEAEVRSILDYYLHLLQAAATGAAEVFQDPVARLHQQAPLQLPPGVVPGIVTLSGGVGELVYAYLQGQPWPATTCFGDLGIDLARWIVESGIWADHLRTYVPAGLGRATVYGLLRYTTQVSGSTVYLTNPALLPLSGLPIVGTVSPASTDTDLAVLCDLVRRTPGGGCMQIQVAGAEVAALGRRIGQVLGGEPWPRGKPVILFLQENLGKVLGQYVTNWGALPVDVVVVDEVAVPDAQYAAIGRLHNQVLPVSFYGLHDRGNAP